MKNNEIKLCFFDLGSVLINVNIDKFFVSFSRLANISLETVLKKSVSLKNVASEFNCGLIKPVDFYNKICNGFGNISFKDFTDAYTNIFSLNEEIAFMATKLKEFVRLSIISNTDELHFEYILQHFPIMKLFESPTTSYQANILKPAKEIFLYALEKVQLTPAECIFIDDNVENIMAANEIKLKGIHFTKVEKLKNDLVNYGFNNL